MSTDTDTQIDLVQAVARLTVACQFGALPADVAEVVDAVTIVLTQLADMERHAADPTAEVTYAVRWPADPTDDEPREEIEMCNCRVDAEHVADRYRSQGAELVQAVRGPWTLVQP